VLSIHGDDDRNVVFHADRGFGRTPPASAAWIIEQLIFPDDVLIFCSTGIAELYQAAGDFLTVISRF